jgi:hypothetical protein
VALLQLQLAGGVGNQQLPAILLLLMQRVWRLHRLLRLACEQLLRLRLRLRQALVRVQWELLRLLQRLLLQGLHAELHVATHQQLRALLLQQLLLLLLLLLLLGLVRHWLLLLGLQTRGWQRLRSALLLLQWLLL